MAFQEVLYRPAFGRTLAVVTVVVCAVGVVALFWGDAASAIRYVWPILLVAVVAWALFWRPSLRMQEHGVTVENVFRTYFIPWPSIQGIDTRYSLTIHTSRGRMPRLGDAGSRPSSRFRTRAQGLRRNRPESLEASTAVCARATR